MDRRISYKLVIDTETCPCDTTEEKVSGYNMLAYDIGWAVVDKRGEVYETKSYINADVFLGEKELMKSAYYANKLPRYWEDITEGTRVLTSWFNIRCDLIETIARYRITEIYAHNMRFDYQVLLNTQRWLTKSKYRYFLPYEVKICDTLKMARDVIAKTPTYVNFCQENGYLTKNGQVKLTAEILYRYITGDMEFEESHTGLEDVLIEKEILRYCYAKHKKMRKCLWDN